MGINLFKNSFIYTFSSIVSASIPFFLLPILTRYLTPSEYGELAMFNLLIAALPAVIGLSAHGAAVRRFFENDITELSLAKFNGNCFFILLFSVVIVFIFIIIADSFIAQFLHIDKSWIYLAIATVSLNFVFNFRLGQWQVRSKAKVYGLFQIFNAFSIFFLCLTFILGLEMGPEGRVYSSFITSILIAILSFGLLMRDRTLHFKYDSNDVSYALNYGVPLIPHVIGGFLLLSIDRLVINKELGLEVTGIYMVAVNLGAVLNVVFNSINKAYTPWLFNQLKESNEYKKTRIVKGTYLYFLFLILLAILCFFVAPPLLKAVVGERFYQAANVLPIILLGQVFLGMYFMVTNYIFYIKKTKYLSYVTISSGILNVVLLLLLLPTEGIYGAAIAFLCANITQFILTWYISARLFKMPWLLWSK